MKEKTNIFINATMIYVSAFLLTTMVHEFGHAFVGYLFGSEPVLHHNFVAHLSKVNLSNHQQVVIALAGPIISLIQGLLSGYIFILSTKRKLIHLFLLWFSILGFNNFLGYIMTGPIFKVGDIGKAYFLLNTPFWLQLSYAIIAAVILLFLAYKITKPFLSFNYHTTWAENGKTRKMFSFHIIILPWIVGSIIMTLLYLPIIAIASIIYPVMSGFVFIYPWQNSQTIQNPSVSKDSSLGRLSKKTILICVVLILVFRLILKPGIAF